MTPLTIAQPRQALLDLPERLAKAADKAVSITRRGRPVLAVMPWELCESIIETLAVLSDPETCSWWPAAGYEPLVAVWVEEDLIVADEFRDGNVPGNKDPLTSVRRAFGALSDWVGKRYFRGDSADYYGPLLKYLVKEQITFSIDVLACPRCGGRMRLVATIHDPGVIRRILAHRGLSHSGQSPGPAPPAPSAAPP